MVSRYTVEWIDPEDQQCCCRSFEELDDAYACFTELPATIEFVMRVVNDSTEERTEIRDCVHKVAEPE
jgi:hypothetical protein